MSAAHSPDDLARALLRRAFDAAVAAVQPRRCVPAHVPAPGGRRTLLVAIGKAAPGMARAFVDTYRAPVTGIVIAPPGPVAESDRRLPGLRFLESAHPVPDERSERAAREVMTLLSGLSPADRVVALISGGGSALLAAPAPGLTLADKQHITRQMLTAGCNIAELNCVRRKLSAVKGGRLARLAAPAEVRVIAISDVPGDDPALIASGPFSPDQTTLADARRVLESHGLADVAAIREFLADESHETPKPGDPAFRRVTVGICACSRDALTGAAGVLAAAGCDLGLTDDRVDAPAGALARDHARLVLEGHHTNRPRALLTGGETTVVVRNPGARGGRNTEYLLELALALNGAPGAFALAAGTDGSDGNAAAAGALLTPDTLARAFASGLDARELLRANRSGEFFAVLGDLLVTGPTGTNVSDVRIVLTGMGPAAAQVVG